MDERLRAPPARTPQPLRVREVEEACRSKRQSANGRRGVLGWPRGGVLGEVTEEHCCRKAGAHHRRATTQPAFVEASCGYYPEERVTHEVHVNTTG